MEERDVALDVVAVEVGVYFGCGNACVAEHFLHGAQVGAALDKVGGEGVSEGVLV